MSAAPEITDQARLDPAQVREVLALIEAVLDADGVSPVSEHVLLHLRHGGDRDAHNLLLREPGGMLAGYAHLDVTDLVEGASAELAVDPACRGRGLAGALVRAVEQRTRDGRLRLWAHGQLPAAQALAHRFGYRRTRVLWQLRMSLLARLPEVGLPDGIGIRPFVVGQDEQAWTEVNNRAFADHPDQGGWSLSEIQTREKEPWFDPAGFLLAMRDSDGALLGFHWTKVHGGADRLGSGADGLGSGADRQGGGADGLGSGADRQGSGADRQGSGHAHEPIGEVYVIAVDPAAQGHGLGPALTMAGLRYLRGRGLSQVMLYVDESNTRAIGVYQRLGFTRWDVDVTYARG